MISRDLSRLKNKEITALERRGLKVCRQISAEGTVLLENNGALPLSPRPVALFGFGARQTIVTGIGSGDVTPRHVVNIDKGLEDAGFSVTTKPWLSTFGERYRTYWNNLRRELEEESRRTGIDNLHLLYNRPHDLLPCQDISEADISESATDTAIYVLSRKEGEGCDAQYKRGQYLPAEWELAHLRKLRSAYRTLILLLNIGSVIDTKEILGIRPDAVVLIYQGGAEIGNAVADVLTGTVPPSGKLTTTWAKDYWDYPNSKTFGNNDGDVVSELYAEGIYVGYRYFDSFNVTPQYAFGHGLTYSTFRLEASAPRLDKSRCCLDVVVTNTGASAGKEVIQVYLSAPSGKLDKPFQQLCTWGKTGMLQTEQSEKVTLCFALEEQASFDEARAAYLLEAGDYIIRVGSSSRRTHVAGIIRLTGDCVTFEVRNLYERPIAYDVTSSASARPWSYDGEKAEIASAPVCQLDPEMVPVRARAEYSNDPPNYFGGVIDPAIVNTGDGEIVVLDVPDAITLDKVNAGECSLEQLVAAMDEDELLHVVTGQEFVHPKYLMNSVSTHVPGACGETTNYFIQNNSPKNIPFTVTADGPAGLRLIKRFQTDEDGNIVFLDPVLGYENGLLAHANYVDGYDDYYQYVTALPISTQLACTWNDDLLTTIGGIVGEEMVRYDIDLWLAPGLNIHRNPLGGRNFEYFSEDPVLSGMLAAAIVRGTQAIPGRGCTIKHMAANNQEAARTSHNAIVAERTMREIYLRGFDLAIRYSNPWSVMTSLNRVNGLHGANNKDISTRTVKDEWGYDGVIMTDWNTTTPERGASTIACINAGTDLIMPGSTADVEHMRAALHNFSGQGDMLTLGAVQKSALQVLKYILKTSRVQQRPNGFGSNQVEIDDGGRP